MPLSELLFSAGFGKAGFGKTEEALVQAIEIARLGGGVWFLDPHADGWKRAKPYLSDPALRSRLWEINLDVRGRDKMLPGWNPLSMQGFSEEDIEDRVDAVVTSFATALGWGDSAPRAKSILTKACEALCYLAMRLPRDCAPTIFQIPTLLDNDEWRQEVLRCLKPSVRRYWTDSFPKLAPDATTVVTNIINRLRTSPTLSAFLGSSRTTYDVRRAMDTGKIVFVCTTGTGETNKLITSFMIYDLFRAGRSRGDTPVDQRRRCDAFVDELAAVDGASRGYLAAILEQLRKYKVALHAMNQMPDRLTGETRRALLQNQLLLMTSAAAIDGARTVAREYGGLVQPATITELEQFHHVITVTLQGQRTTPFKIRGLHVDDEFAEHFHPEWDTEVNQHLDRNLARRRIGDVLDELEDLDERIITALQGDRQPPQSRRGRPPSRSSGAAVELPESTVE
ncbi:ATP-binding protein [Amycolatopsis magusensis]|uniref:ATP-binding protein n=1 Tax=Amycolatopsis magusensis TaxID=882444 RepID=UPI0024A85790|nr:ATP-binding protein [Amycolatopsis magusensis]MDI5975483.1 ATP-binding protein [Amycolatopsis magusensis]